jgi:hypothetical protein
MSPVFRQITNGLYALIWVPVGLAVLLAPLFGFLTLVLWVSGSGGSLDESCQPKTVQAKILATVAPTTFWQEQIDHLAPIAERRFTRPSEQLMGESAKLQEAIAKVSTQASATVQLPSDPALVAADVLRQRADAIEREAQMRKLDRAAFEKHNSAVSSARSCLERSRAHLSAER